MPTANLTALLITDEFLQSVPISHHSRMNARWHGYNSFGEVITMLDGDLWWLVPNNQQGWHLQRFTQCSPTFKIKETINEYLSHSSLLSWERSVAVDLPGQSA
jgi:hypothetical protein